MISSLAPLLPTASLREVERLHAEAGLMEKAGLAAAELAHELVRKGTRILVLAGPGNNGGDALVAARWLKSWWYEITLVFMGDPDRLPPDAAAAYQAWKNAGGSTTTEIPAAAQFELAIDGLFGIGLTRPLEGRYAALIEQFNGLDSIKLALDIPSGLDADTGQVWGTAVEADHTITFIGLKPGLFTLEGPDRAGEVHLADLGIASSPQPSPARDEGGMANGWLIQQAPKLPAKRRRNSHKGNFGDVGILGGAESMVGAAFMAARTALLMGSGRVFAGLLAQHAPTVDMRQPELMVRDASNLLALNLDVLVVGPGLGQSPAARATLSRALQHSATLVLDADALNLIAATPEFRTSLRQRKPGTTVITPHPGEAATLLQTVTSTIQSDRIAAALKLAKEFNAVAVLKGCGSLIATPEGRWFINTSGNPGMAAAGMGDVLAGMIGGLLAQSLDTESATLLSVYLHGATADRLVDDGIGPIGLTASEVAREARNLLNEWLNES